MGGKQEMGGLIWDDGINGFPFFYFVYNICSAVKASHGNNVNRNKNINLEVF